MLHVPTPTQNATTRLRGRRLAHLRRTASQRAAIGAWLVLGEVAVERPTIRQASALAKVSVPYLRRALRASEQERRALAGGRRKVGDLPPARDRELERHWQAATPEERQAFARRVGVAALWDDAIVPSL